MGKKRGFFSSVGTLFRVVILGLAAVMAFALYQNLTKEDAPVVATTDPETPVGDAAEDIAVNAETATEEVADASDDAADAAEADAQETADMLKAEGEAAMESVSEAVESMTDSAEEKAQEADATAENLLNDLTDKAEDAAADAAEGVANLTEAAETTVRPTLNITVDNAEYDVVNRIEDGDAIEVTTARTESDATTYTIRRFTCDPLQVGVIGEGTDVDTITRTEDPEMMPLEDNSVAKEIAAFACANG